MGFEIFVGIVLAVLVCNYVVGVAKYRAWAKPVAIACILVLLLGIVDKIALHVVFKGRARSQVGARVKGLNEGDKARILGRALKDSLPAGARVFVVGMVSSETRMDWSKMWPTWKAGLDEGLEDTTWELVGYFGPIASLGSPPNAQAFDEAIKGLEIDALVSFDGLPSDLGTSAIYQSANPPVVAAFFHHLDSPTVEKVNRWMEGKLLQAALVEEKLFTSF